ncbi:MAG TPA: type VI secretion system membrane subunit TssM [Roseiarcus sp.]|jgi:type VI secretion system protein ImpL
MTVVAWIWIALSIVGAITFSLLVWFAGPIISIGDVQPFESFWLRFAIILLVWIIVLASIAYKIIKRRRAAAALEKALTEAVVDETDAPVLAEKMQDALATLKKSGKSSTSYLYDLPWYLIIGPPGAGKTTALVNSGLRFPLANDTAARAVQGVGGTRYCDWWFTDEAVLIDTAGRYTTQDSDAKVDRKSWLAFLDMLRTNRPRQPINGVLVAISIEDVLKLAPAEVNAHADAIRKRLTELHDELKISFPVYAVFTKMDLIVGFTQYFADLDEVKRRFVWGATFQTADKKANNVGTVPAEIDLLVNRISERMPERLQEEPDLRARAILFGLPAQISAIKKPVSEFLGRIFEPTRYQTSATLRGFYFTSGTQEGTPFDQVIGALQRSYGVESFSSAAFSGAGKSFFLHDLLTKVVFGEAGWVSTNMGAVRRSFFIRAAAFSLIAVVMAVILGAWWVSYSRNRTLIADTDRAVDSYAAAAGPLLKQDTISDSDLRPVYERIDGLLNLPTGYATRDEATPVPQTFGLSQRPRLESASESTYQLALERLMRPRLVLRLEQQIQKNINEPSFVYEALKVYLMLGGKAPAVDKDLILDWFARDWEENMYPGAPYAQGRELLREHLAAMLDLDVNGTPKISLNGPLVEQAQATLSRMRVSERAYTLLKSEAHTEKIEDWIASRRGGPDMALVFEAANGASLDTVRVPAFFTYQGFYHALLDHMTTIADKMQKEQWVLGPSGGQEAVKQQYASIMPDIIDLYGKEFINAWNIAIGNLALRPLVADKPKYLVLSAASAPTSPIKQIFESIRDETAVTREPKAPPSSALNANAAQDATRIVGNHLGTTGREALSLAMKSQRRAGDPAPEVPGASIEANFKPFQVLLEGEAGSRPIDALLANLNELYRELTLAATNPAQAKQAIDQVQVQVASLRSNVTRLPQPLAGMMDRVARDVAGDANDTSVAQLSQALADQVTGACQQAIANRYPFAKSDRDVPLADFARVFAPGGVIDRFFATNLAPLANLSGKTWTWRPNANLSRKLSDTTLRQFQEAAEIRDAFFPTGGNQPNVSLEVKPVTLSGEATSATLQINGASVASQQGANTPTTVQWPGAGAGEASIAMQPEMPDRISKLERSGPWALFRLVDTGSALQRGNAVSASFVVGGREVSYQFSAASLNNPLSMPSLRQFKCPNGL